MPHDTIRTIQAPALAVYAAMLDPDALETWLPPAGAEARIVAFDPRPGGHFRMFLTFHDTAPADAPAHRLTAMDARFVDLVPARQIVQAITFNTPAPSAGRSVRMVWLLTPVEDGTQVTCRMEAAGPHELEDLPEAADLPALLEQLDVYLTGEQPMPLAAAS